ncbi:MAG: OmpA family protein [Spirochaetes bacterium]|nr:OmpA family protein [Spirochaetota bacterium]
MKTLCMTILISAAILAMNACAKDQIKEPVQVGANNAFVTGSNEQLAKYPVAGFAYKSATVPERQWKTWARVASPAVKDILGKIPDGYVLEVRGHADASGPEKQEGDKPGNMNISRDRAKAVVKALASEGIESRKITYKGVGSSEPLTGYAPRSGQQRRVTFSIVPQ